MYVRPPNNFICRRRRAFRRENQAAKRANVPPGNRASGRHFFVFKNQQRTTRNFIAVRCSSVCSKQTKREGSILFDFPFSCFSLSSTITAGRHLDHCRRRHLSRGETKGRLLRQQQRDQKITPPATHGDDGHWRGKVVYIASISQSQYYYSTGTVVSLETRLVESRSIDDDKVFGFSLFAGWLVVVKNITCFY